MRTRATLFLNISVVLVTVFLCLILLETALALFWPHKITARPFYHIQNFFCQYHPLMGWINKPGYSDVVTVSRDSSFVVTHNSKGLRDREHPYERTPGTFRVLALGDSFAWGFGVQDNEVFAEILESLNPSLEVINMGVSGYGTDQELLYYTEEGYRYDHDLVVLLFYVNDVSELSSSISYRYPKPFFTPDADPLTVINVPVPKTSDTERNLFDNPSTNFGKVKKFLRRNTHTYPFITLRLNAIPWLRQLFLKIGLAEDPSIRGGIPLYRVDSEEEAWNLLYRLIMELRTISAENRAEFVLVHIPIREAPPENAQGYEGNPEKYARQNDDVSKRLNAFASENALNYIDLLTVIREGHFRGIRYYNTYERDIHLNAEGHRLLAQTVLQWMQERKEQ
jgi:lysophospholipase L1-like esterase